jgi:hypothetical protein
MSRLVILIIIIGACSNSKGTPPTAQASPAKEPSIDVPREGSVGGAATVTGKHDPCTLTEIAKRSARDPAFQLKPDEGTLTIGKLEGAPGVAASGEIKLAPGSGYKVADDFSIRLLLEQPDHVKLAKTCMTAGGRAKLQGDASRLSEKELAFSVNATVATAGTYEISGVLMFGVCGQGSCRPRTQPITIQVAAK